MQLQILLNNDKFYFYALRERLSLGRRNIKNVEICLKMSIEHTKNMDMRPHASFVGGKIQIEYAYTDRLVFSPSSWIYVLYGGRPTKMQVMEIMIHPRDGLWFVCLGKSRLTYEVCIEDIVGIV